MFLKYLAKMDLILTLPKCSGQIGPKPKYFVFHSTIHQHGQTGQNGLIVEWNTKHLGFGPIWPEHVGNVRMRSISLDIWET